LSGNSHPKPNEDGSAHNAALDDVTISTAPNDVTISTAPNDVTISTAPNDVTISTAPNDVTISTAPNDVTISTAPNDVTISTAPNGTADEAPAPQIDTVVVKDSHAAKSISINITFGKKLYHGILPFN
jgi:hypothetical protein